MEFTHKELVEKIIAWAEEKKAEEIVHIDVAGKSSYTDSLIICHGKVDIHVKAIAEYLIDKIKEHKIHLMSTEGLDNGRWVLIDLGEVIVHVFLKPVRDYYDLEDLWKITPKRKKEMEANHVER